MSQRNIINISMPPTMTKEVHRGVKKLHCASTSEFFRHLLREWMGNRLATELEEGRREHAAGKTKKMKNTKDLWK